jgi:hypothetical protein
MDNISPEVLIYLQSVKNYFETNVEARSYFLDNSNEELFYKHMTEIAQKNFEKHGTATLDREQFELLRRTILALTIAESNTFTKKDIEFKNEDFDYDNGVFIGFPNFGFICLN